MGVVADTCCVIVTLVSRHHSLITASFPQLASIGPQKAAEHNVGSGDYQGAGVVARSETSKLKECVKAKGHLKQPAEGRGRGAGGPSRRLQRIEMARPRDALLPLLTGEKNELCWLLLFIV